MFQHAIIRKPGKSFKNGQSSSDLGSPDYDKTLLQHKAYVNALKKCGLNIIELAPDENFPDSCFVEDTAIVTQKCAIITQPGHPSRKGEEIKIEETIKDYRQIEKIEGQGLVDGGDIMHAENHFYIGLSDRTNQEGADQLKNILAKHGHTASCIEVKDVLHLKSGVNYIGDNTISVMDSLAQLPDLKSYKKIPIIESETYASNCVLVNDYLIIAKGFENTKQKFIEAGYKIIELDMSEFEKMDGGLSCLSLRF